MKRFSIDYIVFPLILILPFFLDGILTVYTYPVFITSEHQLIWQLTAVTFFSAMMFMPRRHYVYWAFIIGLLYDFYYSPILSFYTAPLVIIVYIYRLVLPKFKPTFFSQFLLIMLLLLSLNCLQYVVAMIYQMAVPDIMVFLSQKVFPTIVLNSLVFCIVYPIFQTIFLAMDRVKN